MTTPIDGCARLIALMADAVRHLDAVNDRSDLAQLQHKAANFLLAVEYGLAPPRTYQERIELERAAYELKIALLNAYSRLVMRDHLRGNNAQTAR